MKGGQADEVFTRRSEHLIIGEVPIVEFLIVLILLLVLLIILLKE